MSMLNNIVLVLDSINTFKEKCRREEIRENRTIAYYGMRWLLIIPIRIHSTIISDMSN